MQMKPFDSATTSPACASTSRTPSLCLKSTGPFSKTRPGSLASPCGWSAHALIAALVWANFAVLEEVTTGEGKAIPSSKIQVIQNLEGGIVSEIFVREGQIVEQGAVLLRLDDTRLLSNRGEAEADRLALVARVERLSAEAEGRPIKHAGRNLTRCPAIG